jgi:hypothetical protein
MIESADQKARLLRLRAEELRTIAAGMRHPSASRDLAGVAAQLDRMARRAEDRKAGLLGVQRPSTAEGSESHPARPPRRIVRGGRYASRRAKFLSMDS